VVCQAAAVCDEKSKIANKYYLWFCRYRTLPGCFACFCMVICRIYPSGKHKFIFLSAVKPSIPAGVGVCLSDRIGAQLEMQYPGLKLIILQNAGEF